MNFARKDDEMMSTFVRANSPLQTLIFGGSMAMAPHVICGTPFSTAYFLGVVVLLSFLTLTFALTEMIHHSVIAWYLARRPQRGRRFCLFYWFDNLGFNRT